MEGARCIVVLCLLAATLSLHSVSCKPLNFQGVNRFFPTRTSVPTKSLTYSPMPVPGFSPYPDPYASRGPYRQNYGNGFDPFSREQAVDSDAQFVGLGIGAARLGYEALKAAGRVALKYWPDVRECINSFVNLNDPNDEMSLQNDREALVNELESTWKRGVEYKAREEMFNEQASKYWPLISDCIDRFVDRASGDDTGRETAEQQGVRRAAKNLLLNYAVSTLANQRGPNGNVQETSEPRANEQFWETLAPILLNYGLNKWRENQNENDGNNGKLQANANIARGRGTSSLTPRAQVQRNYAAMQGRFSNLFNAENWNIGKECLNDVFGDTDDGRMTPREQAAMVSEFESVWRGQTDLSMASAQVRLNWGTVRDCIDRFANKDNPTAAASSLFSRIGGLFNSGNWEIARECLNDVFGDSDDSGMTAREQAAVISEFESVWKGQTDLSMASAQVGLNWGTVRDCVDRFVNKDNPTSQCSNALYVMAYTGGTTNSHSTNTPLIELIVDGEIRQTSLLAPPDQRNKGDIWKIDLSEFGFSEMCIKAWDVEGIAVVENGYDGWLIDSIVTFLRNDGGFSLLSSDIDAFRWVDRDSGTDNMRFDLTLTFEED